MKLFKVFLALFVVSFFSFNLLAGDSSSGCGLGWNIAPKTSLLSSTIRNTTHVFLPNTFSMTFGTSGCSQHSIVKNESKAIHYAEANFHQLMTEMSMGRGEFLTGFASVLGCGGSVDAFGKVLQNNYGDVFSSDETTPVQMYQNVKKQINSNQALANACRMI